MSEEEKSVEALRAENEALRKRMEKLEEQVNPKPFKSEYRGPIDYTEGMRMPRNAMQAMIDAVPESLMAELRADARKPNPVTQASQSPITSTSSAQSQPNATRQWMGRTSTIGKSTRPKIRRCANRRTRSQRTVQN